MRLQIEQLKEKVEDKDKEQEEKKEEQKEPEKEKKEEAKKENPDDSSESEISESDDKETQIRKAANAYERVFKFVPDDYDFKISTACDE